ncbi:hypothetical protein EMIT0196MI5_140141 [Pseudomonas sp. IT-196MI5]
MCLEFRFFSSRLFPGGPLCMPLYMNGRLELTTLSFSGASDLALPRFTATVNVLRRIVAFF